MAWLTDAEIARLGFARLGRNVRISDRAAFHNCAAITIGDHSRIDDFCVLSAGIGGIIIGSYVHVAVYCGLMGAGRIEMQDFSGLSARVSLYSSNDDYSGAFLTNPSVPAAYTNVASAPVVIGRHAIIGAGTVILPGVTLHEGAGVGALSLVKRDCEAFGLYSGVPARRIGARKRDLLEQEARLRRDAPE